MTKYLPNLMTHINDYYYYYSYASMSKFSIGKVVGGTSGTSSGRRRRRGRPSAAAKRPSTKTTATPLSTSAFSLTAMADHGWLRPKVSPKVWGRMRKQGIPVELTACVRGVRFTAALYRRAVRLVDPPKTRQSRQKKQKSKAKTQKKTQNAIMTFEPVSFAQLDPISESVGRGLLTDSVVQLCFLPGGGGDGSVFLPTAMVAIEAATCRAAGVAAAASAAASTSYDAAVDVVNEALILSGRSAPRRASSRRSHKPSAAAQKAGGE